MAALPFQQIYSLSFLFDIFFVKKKNKKLKRNQTKIISFYNTTATIFSELLKEKFHS